MTKTAIFFLFFIFLFRPGFCENNDSFHSEPLPDKEKKAALEHLNGLQRGINSITAEIRQVKKSRLLKNEIKLDGKVSLKKPNFLRWEITSPKKMITAVSQEKMVVYHPDSKEAQVYNLSEDIVARNMANFFSASFHMSVEEMEKRFLLNVFRVDESIIIELRPRSKTISRYLDIVRMWYNEKTGLPVEFEITGKKGDITHTRFKDIVVNPALTDDIFSIVLPDDVWITNKTGPAVSN